VLVVTQLGSGLYSVRSPLDGLEVVDKTPEAAAEQVLVTLRIKAMAERRLKLIRKLTQVAYDPGQKCYVADYFRGAIVAHGYTRQDAFDKILTGIRISDQAMREAAKDAELAAEVDALGQLPADLSSTEDTSPADEAAGLGIATNPGETE
jgi:hypothetical protein